MLLLLLLVGWCEFGNVVVVHCKGQGLLGGTMGECSPFGRMLLGLRFGGDEIGAYPDGNVVTGGGESVMTMGKGEVAGWMNG